MFKLIHSLKIQVLIIVFLSLAAYSNIFANQFVWDDQFFIQEWTQIRDLQNLPLMLKGGLPPKFSGAFRPGLSLAYLIFYFLFGQNSFGWHLQALVVHLACTLLVFLIVKNLIKNTRDRRLIFVPFLSALFFGLHPIHTEAVSYISASINNIGVMFFLSSFYLYLLNKKIASLICAFGAFFTYEFTLTLPLVIALHQLTFSKGIKLKILIPRLFRITWSYFLLVFFYILARVLVIGSVGRGGYPLNNFYLTMLTMAKAFLKYLELLVLPINQSINHTLPGGIVSGYYIDLKNMAIAAQHFWSPYTILAILMLGILLIIAVKSRKSQPLTTFSIGWFLITLLPASNLIPVQEFMAERYLYLPSVGFCLSLAWVISNLKYRALLVGLIILAFAYLTFGRNLVWKDSLSLWSDTVKKTPLSEIAYFNLGNAYQRAGQTDQAIASYLQAIANKPSSMGSFINLGNIYMSRRQLNLAKNAFSQALSIDPRSATNYSNLGAVLTEQGYYQEALEKYLQALILDPNHPSSQQNLQVLLAKDPKLDVSGTLKNLQQSQISIDPSWRAYSDGMISFNYPADWRVSSEKQEQGSVVISSPGQDFNIKIGKVQKDLGLLIKQGQAQIPGFDRSEVKIYRQGSTQLMQFFLTQGGKDIQVVVFPADSLLMSEFDRIISSLKL